MKCPLCKHERFYLKDPDDPYETYCFSSESGDIRFDADPDPADIPQLAEDTTIYCDHCAWNGPFRQVK